MGSSRYLVLALFLLGGVSHSVVAETAWPWTFKDWFGNPMSEGGYGFVGTKNMLGHRIDLDFDPEISCQMPALMSLKLIVNESDKTKFKHLMSSSRDLYADMRINGSKFDGLKFEVTSVVGWEPEVYLQLGEPVSSALFESLQKGDRVSFKFTSVEEQFDAFREPLEFSLNGSKASVIKAQEHCARGLERAVLEPEYVQFITEHHDGDPISAECFQFHWGSSDNIEWYSADLRISDPRFGQYVGEFITDETLQTLAREIEKCGRKTDAEIVRSRHTFYGRKYVKSSMYYGDPEIYGYITEDVNYRVLRAYPTKFCSDQISADLDIKYCWLLDMQPYRNRELSLTAIDSKNRFIPVRWNITPNQFPEFGFEASWVDLN